MKVKVNDASGLVLDWMVAKCEGIQLNDRLLKRRVLIPSGITGAIQNDCNYSPTEYWAQGGPIIEREKIEVRPFANYWIAVKNFPSEYGQGIACTSQQGKYPLIAAMRCYVASKLGDEVEVPDEIVKP